MSLRSRDQKQANADYRATASRSWRASLIRKKGRVPGDVEAPSREAAERAAVRTFKLSPEQRSGWWRRSGAKHRARRLDMKVICPKCRATTNLGPNRSDLIDARYKLECPVLRERRIAQGSDINIECLYMRRVIDSAILKFRRVRKAKRQQLGIEPVGS
jgi:hypothetical protein